MKIFKLNPPPRYDEEYFEAMRKMDAIASGESGMKWGDEVSWEDAQLISIEQQQVIRDLGKRSGYENDVQLNQMLTNRLYRQIDGLRFLFYGEAKLIIQLLGG